MTALLAGPSHGETYQVFCTRPLRSDERWTSLFPLHGDIIVFNGALPRIHIDEYIHSGELPSTATCTPRCWQLLSSYNGAAWGQVLCSRAPGWQLLRVCIHPLSTTLPPPPRIIYITEDQFLYMTKSPVLSVRGVAVRFGMSGSVLHSTVLTLALVRGAPER